MDEPSEDELIRRARDGDQSAYEVLVKTHQSIALRVAWLVTGNAADAEDATQAAFVKAYRALGRFRSGASFRPWLLTIVGNEARNVGRSSRRREELTLRLTEDRPSAGAAPSPEEAILAGARREQLVRALDRLPVRDRQALACRYFLELSEAETAAAVGCARGTVKSRLSRALGRLRAAAAAEGIEPEVLS